MNGAFKVKTIDDKDLLELTEEQVELISGGETSHEDLMAWSQAHGNIDVGFSNDLLLAMT